MFNMKYAEPGDRQFWFTLDRHMGEPEFELKVRDRRCYIIFDGELPIGVLRYGLFWDNTPFLNLIELEASCQRRGIGTLAMAFWEDEMQRLGYRKVMTSTQSDEQAQHFYRRLGYRDCGVLLQREGEPSELFFVKELE